MNLKKIGKVFTSKFVETGPSFYKKRIYRAAVSQRLGNSALGFTYTGGDIAADALWVLYNDMLTNSSTLPAKLRRRRDTDHPVC